MTDHIYIRQLEVETTIGAFAWEQQLLQKLWLDFSIYYDMIPAANSDDLLLAIDYARLTEIVKKFSLESHHQLIETFAHRLADLLLNEFPIDTLEIRISKPQAIQHVKDIGVVIRRAKTV